jgi:para-nitrobenzyl esterase
MVDHKLNRRSVLHGAIALGGALLAESMPSVGQSTTQGGAVGAAGKAGGRDRMIVSDKGSVVETASGKVRGLQRNGVHIFRGIPYGGNTEGTNRFLPATKPKPWTGIRSALYYGPVCPHGPRAGWANDENAFLFQWNDGIAGEDMLRINVWTPGLNDGKKRTVMFWIHGGGYTSGSGQELMAYEGENLCKRGDVVVVTMNHRLNALGFFNLVEMGGEKYARSANVGMTDLVAALEWVRDNITQFGGDPGSVMIFGQSGGGGKVSTLMAMPEAKGLFHRAAVQSGSMLGAQPGERSAEFAAAILKELEISKNNIDKIQTVSYEKIANAGNVVLRNFRRPPTDASLPGPNFATFSNNPGWGPSVDGLDIPSSPWTEQAPAESANVPLLVGTVLNEFNTGMDKPDCFSMTKEDLYSQVSAVYGAEKGRKVVDAFQAGHPKANPFQLWSIVSAHSVRGAAIKQARIKEAQRGAPVYLYWFQWQTPVLDDRPMAFHCADIGFCFDNADVCETMTGAGAAALHLSARMGQAWINFAKTGDPNHSDLPKWKPVSASVMPTMIFDNVCSVVNNVDEAEQAAINAT